MLGNAYIRTGDRRIGVGGTDVRIRPSVVTGAKRIPGHATATAALGCMTRKTLSVVKRNGIIPISIRSFIATATVFSFIEAFRHYLAAGLLFHGRFFVPPRRCTTSKSSIRVFNSQLASL